MEIRCKNKGRVHISADFQISLKLMENKHQVPSETLKMSLYISSSTCLKLTTREYAKCLSISKVIAVLFIALRSNKRKARSKKCIHQINVSC